MVALITFDLSWHCQPDLLHCKVMAEGVSDADLKVGRELLVHYGSSEEMKNRVVLNTANVFTRAAMFHKFMSRHPLGATFGNTMVEMHRTGKYIPDARWLIPTAGRGMVAARAETAWKMYLQPDKVTRADVNAVYFQEAQSLRDETLRVIDDVDAPSRQFDNKYIFENQAAQLKFELMGSEFGV